MVISFALGEFRRAMLRLSVQRDRPYETTVQPGYQTCRMSSAART